MIEPNRIYTGDSLALAQQLEPRSIDLICSDPPYGGNEVGGQNCPPIANNTTPLTGLLAIQRSLPALKLNRFCIVFLNQQHQPFYDLFFRRYTSLRVRGYIVWDKRNVGLGWGVRTRHELIAVYEKGKPAYKNGSVASVLPCPRTTTDIHPNMKPLELMKALVTTFSSPGDVVLDPFAGSGTTLVAAKEARRRFIGFEVDPHYADIARNRIQNATIEDIAHVHTQA